jgi:hypothetical protein
MQIIDLDVQLNSHVSNNARDNEVGDEQTIHTIEGQERSRETMCNELCNYLG